VSEQLHLAMVPSLMRTVVDDPRCRLLHGRAEDLSLPPDSVDAVIADPPAGIDFMGKGWDSDKGGRDSWIAWLITAMRPAFDALKPGGHALVWALPRTSHWTATAMEDLGFEIRDIHMHLFGTGFPKSLDVSKAIDKALGVTRPMVGPNPNHRSVSGVAYDGVYAGGNTGAADVTGPGSDEAASWAGWGTALKPACEHWILCRKPLAGTVAANVLAHGTGGLNIDGCRIDGGSRPLVVSDRRSGDVSYGDGLQGSVAVPGGTDLGRWPAHVSFDEEAAAVLDEQSGTRKDGVATNVNRDPESKVSWFGTRKSRTDRNVGYGGGGGASRFFYVAKGSPAEKDAGLEHLPVKTGGEASGRADDSKGVDNPRAGAGRGGGRRNFHPTVKSIALMRWLVKLITPPGGIVLDPFAGSGSTGVAALAEGMRFIGVEQGGEDDEYLPIIEGRLRNALAQAVP
jgi:site-specific DNA-methyltransferase (adenine-specific)